MSYTRTNSIEIDTRDSGVSSIKTRLSTNEGLILNTCCKWQLHVLKCIKVKYIKQLNYGQL